MTFFKPKYRLFPLVNVIAAFAVIIFGLIEAKTAECSWFLLCFMAWICVFGCLKSTLRMLPMLVVIGGLFALISYLTSGEWMSALAMFNRFAAIFLGMACASSCSTTSTVRCLSQIHCPRSVTLGTLITTSFMPLLRVEIKRVREAMRTRGAGSILNPKIFYRAFLVPFVMRLVNISDTLSLSVETRGFSLGKTKYSVYHPEIFGLTDVIFMIGLVAGMVLAVVL